MREGLRGRRWGRVGFLRDRLAWFLPAASSGAAVAKLAEFQIDKVQEQGAGPQDCGADVEVDIGGTGAKVKGGMATGVEGCVNK